MTNTAQIRRLLNTAFDDPGLDAFCLDYFYDVFNHFSRGMRKDEKITLLLDHCRRTANGFEVLRRAARSEYEASGSQRDELRTLAEALGPSPAESALSPGQPAPAKDSAPLPRLRQIKIKTRQDRLEALVKQYEAANRQLSSTLDAANRVIIERQIKDLEQEIQAVEDELNQLRGAV
jgi:DNA repair exonuclease SbcCD ATPase subunit